MRLLNMGFVRKALGLNSGQSIGGEHNAKGVVAKYPEVNSHFVFEDDGCTVFVELDDGRTVPCDLRVCGGAGGDVGHWKIPAVGTRVVVAFPDHDDQDAYIVGTYSLSPPPDDLTEGRHLILAGAGGEIWAYDEDGNAVSSLVLKSEYDAFKDAYDNHIHDAPQAAAGSLPTSIPSKSTPHGTLVGAADPAPACVGTQTFKSN